MPTRLFSVNIGSGGGSGGTGVLVARSGTQAISNGSPTVDITFSSAMASTAYAIEYSIINTTDATPIFLQGVVTTIATTGFTITLNAAADTANYSVTYGVQTYV